MKKRYTISKKKLPEADEPVAVYNSTKQIVSNTLSEIPEGHVTLEQFGTHFHQKLDDCYEKLQGDCQ
ncbi:MAG: hypothetical protein J6T56_03100 [Bacteroidales bacterium]|nr:hypothetical protein [Bacteroidales bacterium]